MVGRKIAAILVLFCLVLNGGCAARRLDPIQHSQQKSKESDKLAQWTNVLNLKRNTRIEIATKDGRIIKGKLTDATSDSISILDEVTNQVTKLDLDKEEVYQIRKLRMSSGKSALWGALVGAGISASIGAALASQEDIIAAAIPIGAAIWASIGALIGYLNSKGKGELIYVSP